MIEVEKAIAEIKRRREDIERQIRLEQHTTKPSSVRISALESNAFTLHSKLSIIQSLKREVEELEYSLTMKMMTRYPENQRYRVEWRRDLHRSKRRLAEMAALYQPVEKKRPRWAA